MSTEDELATARATIQRPNRKMQELESARTARRDRYAELGYLGESALATIKRLHRNLNNWEADGHTTVTIAHLRKAFDFPTLLAEPTRRKLRR